MQHLTLTIENGTNEYHKVRILHAINIDKKNFGIPSDVTIKCTNQVVPYENILRHLLIARFPLSFISSTNNRQLNFGLVDFWAGGNPIEPHKNIDGTPREKYRGKEIQLRRGIIFESDMYENNFIDKWDAEKWNIADTHEPAIWTATSYVDVLVKPQQTFELQLKVYLTDHPFLHSLPVSRKYDALK